MSETSVTVATLDASFYAQRGLVHDLEYYDGPLLSAQMCIAVDNTHMVEVSMNLDIVETDGHMMYVRMSKEDLQTMLRIIEEEPVELREHCGQSPGGKRDSCASCNPSPHENRDE